MRNEKIKNMICILTDDTIRDRQKMDIILMHKKEVYDYIKNNENDIDVDILFKIFKMFKKYDKYEMFDFANISEKIIVRNDYEFIKKYKDEFDSCDYSGLFLSINLNLDIIEFLINENILSLDEIIRKYNVSEEVLEKYIDSDINWDIISLRYKLSYEFIDKHSNLLNWDNLSSNNNLLNEEFIRKYKSKLNFRYISRYFKMSEEFIIEMKDFIDFNIISETQRLSEKFIDKYKDELNWNSISLRQKISEEFIENNLEYIDFKNLSYNINYLSEDFIRKYIDRIDLNGISNYVNLSNEFIDDFKEQLNWENISESHSLSDEFIERYKDHISFKVVINSQYCIPDDLYDKIKEYAEQEKD